MSSTQSNIPKSAASLRLKLPSPQQGWPPGAVEAIGRPDFLRRLPSHPALSPHALLGHVVPPIPKPFRVSTTYWPPPMQAAWVSMFFPLINLLTFILIFFHLLNFL